MKNIALFVAIAMLIAVGCAEKEEYEVTKPKTTEPEQMQPAPTMPPAGGGEPAEPIPAPAPGIRAFVIEADDLSFVPSSVEVNAGDTVKITFKVRKQRVGFGGLDFKSNFFNTGTVKPGDSTTVEFKADKTFTFSSFWPKSNTKKTDGKVIVKK